MNVKIIILLMMRCCLLGCFPVMAQVKVLDSLEASIHTMPEDTVKLARLRTLYNGYKFSDVKKSFQFAQQELALSRSLHDLTGEAHAYRHIGMAYDGLGNRVKAIEYYLKALRVYEQLDSAFEIAACYNNIGIVYEGQYQFEEALNYFRKAHTIWSNAKEGEEGESIALANIAEVYLKQEKDSIALHYYLEALKMSEMIRYDAIISESASKAAMIYLKLGRYKAARASLLKALKLSLANDDKETQVQVYNGLSQVYAATRQLPMALAAAKKGLSIAQQDGDVQALAGNYDQLSKVYAQMQYFRQAYHFQQLYRSLTDSLNKAENLYNIEKLQYDDALGKKDIQNQDLLKEQKLKEAQIQLQKEVIQRQHIVSRFIGLGFIFFVVISFIYYRSFMVKKKDNALLNRQKEEIRLQHEAISAQNREILIQKENLARINHAKDKLFSIISHDLRSPMTTLEGLLLMLKDQTFSIEEFQFFSDALLKNVNNTSSMLENMLYWVKNQMEGIRADPEVFDVRQVLINNIQHFQINADTKKITLVNEVQSIKVYADVFMLDIVIRNLLSNAVKFSRAGDRIVFSATAKENLVFISIRDTGKGIAPDVMQKLFDPLEFYSTYGTANEKGTGLGLRLCYDFVVMNGGSVSVESEVGKGSCFTFTIPLAGSAMSDKVSTALLEAGAEQSR